MTRSGILWGILGLTCVHATEPHWSSVRRAVLDHPALEHTRQTGRQALADLAFSGQKAIPTLELELENFAGTGTSKGLQGVTSSAWIGQEFRLGNVRKAQQQLAKSQASLIEFDTLIRRQNLLWDARTAHEQWLQARARASLQDSVLLDLTNTLEQTRRALVLGKSSPWEITRLEGELREGMAQRDQWLREASHHWQRQFPRTSTLPEPTSVTPLEPLEQALLVEIPAEQLQMERELQAQTSQAALLAQEDRPTLAGSVGVLHDQPSGDLGLGVRLQMPLTGWKRTSFETRRAQAEAGRMTREMAISKEERARKVHLQKQRIDAAQEDRLRVLEAVTDRQKTLALMEDAYRKGALDPHSVWTAREALWTARERAQESLLTLRTLELERQLLEGCEP